MKLRCDHIQKQELNIERDLKHKRKLDEERMTDQNDIVRTLIRYMNEDLETISGSLSTSKDLAALEMLKEAVDTMLMQWEVVYEDFRIRQAAMLKYSFPAYKQLLNEKLSLYLRLACATTDNKVLMEKETMKVTHVAAEAKSQSVIGAKEELIGNLNASITDLRNKNNFLMSENQAANHLSQGMWTDVQIRDAMIKQTMTGLESTKAELQSAKKKITDLEKAAANKDIIISSGHRKINDLQQAVTSAENNMEEVKVGYFCFFFHSA
jgi:uncharacterized protein (DUF3084 family)